MKRWVKCIYYNYKKTVMIFTCAVILLALGISTMSVCAKEDLTHWYSQDFSEKIKLGSTEAADVIAKGSGASVGINQGTQCLYFNAVNELGTASKRAIFKLGSLGEKEQIVIEMKVKTDAGCSALIALSPTTSWGYKIWSGETEGNWTRVKLVFNIYSNGSIGCQSYVEKDGSYGERVDSKLVSGLTAKASAVNLVIGPSFMSENSYIYFDDIQVYYDELSSGEELPDVSEMPKIVDGVTVVEMKSPYAAPPVTPPVNQHPRVLFTPEDIPTIRANLTHSENIDAYMEFLELKNTEYDGILRASKTNNYDAHGLAVIEAKAFDYIINRDSTDVTIADTAEASGKAAISAIINYIKTLVTLDGFFDRESMHTIFVAGEVYDWCHDLLSEAQKETIVARCQLIAREYSEGGFPPGGYSNNIADHSDEAVLNRDWIAFGIATYDEYPEIYNYVAGRYFEKFVPARNYFYRAGAFYQGTSYGGWRFMCNLYAQLLLSNMSKTDEVEYILCEETGTIPYQWIYMRRPDGELLRQADDSEDRSGIVEDWYVGSNKIFVLSSNFYKDGVLKGEYLKNKGFKEGHSYMSAVQILAINDPSIQTQKVEELPLTKTIESPIGGMIARTGWSMGVDSPDVLAYMKIGEVNTGNHEHDDAGNFQIYYKGILASESGAYLSYSSAHNVNYNQSSIAHNTLAITSTENKLGKQYDPGSLQSMLSSYTSGQRTTGEVTGQEYGPDLYKPEYTYIAGDIAKAYDDNVQEAVRSMLFLPLDLNSDGTSADEKYPAAFVVFDRITTTEAGSKKTFMLHMQSEPSVDGNVTVITNTEEDYNGMLTNQTLLPSNVDITMIGGEGKEFMVGDTNYNHGVNNIFLEDGWGRVEISTTAATGNQTDYFLNVMYVNDADLEAALEKAELIETSRVVGTKIFNRVAVFNKEKARTSEEITFEIPADTEVSLYKVNVAGLEAGKWTIQTGSGSLTEIATKEGGMVYFDAPAGACTLTRTGDATEQDEVAKFTANAPVVEDYIAMRVNYRYVYDAIPIRDGNEIYIPVKKLFRDLDAEITEEGDKVSITLRDNTLQVTSSEATVTSVTGEKQSTTKVKTDGEEFYLSMSFLNEGFKQYISMQWNGLVSMVDVESKISDNAYSKYKDIYENFINIQSAVAGGNTFADDAVIELAMDGDLATRWVEVGLNRTLLATFDFGSVYELDDILIAYYKGASRNAAFEVEVSTDGVIYSGVESLSGKITTDGKSAALVPYNAGGAQARYLRLYGYGHTDGTGVQNSITEIVFTGTPLEGEVEAETETQVDELYTGADVSAEVNLLFTGALLSLVAGVCVVLISVIRYKKRNEQRREQ